VIPERAWVLVNALGTKITYFPTLYCVAMVEKRNKRNFGFCCRLKHLLAKGALLVKQHLLNGNEWYLNELGKARISS
jgi:hypothetical protein